MCSSTIKPNGPARRACRCSNRGKSCANEAVAGFTESGDQGEALEQHRPLAGVFHAFPQYRLGASVAFAAAGAEVEMIAQLRHRRQAGINRLADGSVGYVIADTYNHQDTL